MIVNKKTIQNIVSLVIAPKQYTATRALKEKQHWHQIKNDNHQSKPQARVWIHQLAQLPHCLRDSGGPNVIVMKNKSKCFLFSLKLTGSKKRSIYL